MKPRTPPTRGCSDGRGGRPGSQRTTTSPPAADAARAKVSALVRSVSYSQLSIAMRGSPPSSPRAPAVAGRPPAPAGRGEGGGGGRGAAGVVRERRGVPLGRAREKRGERGDVRW